MAQHCCIKHDYFKIDPATSYWNDKNFIPLREKNKSGIWDAGCLQCKSLEDSGYESFRTGMNQGLGIYPRTDLSGPSRIDLSFDTGCNLACRTCGPRYSTSWQKYLGLPITAPHHKDQVIAALQQLDLTNLRMLVFAGGETLLGQQYWEVAEWLADNVPNAQQQLTLCFQTNGTQPIQVRNHSIIEKFFLVRLHVSLDGIGPRFEYLRWPASWSQVTDNLMTLRQNAPSNVMFLVEETISIFNLAYLNELDSWVKQNFATNREGDPVNHTRHMANGIFGLDNCGQEYREWCVRNDLGSLLPQHWQESAVEIRAMLDQIAKHDHMRSQRFADVFPEVAGFYRRFV
jgi:sulfatase maturation enzyme AslB (radical SAM superfamily)